MTTIHKIVWGGGVDLTVRSPSLSVVNSVGCQGWLENVGIPAQFTVKEKAGTFGLFWG